jgi:uncharacterized protein
MTISLAKSLQLPTEFTGRRTAVFGISGSGKSNTATVLVEQLLKAGEQVVMIDPKGEGWGLLSLASGKPSNLPVIVFGEPNGHIESLSESHGPRLADFVVESGRSVVLSLLGFESDQSERRFVATFLRQLYRRKSRQGQPTRTLVVIDEAHLFVPENVRGDAAELAGAVQRIVRQGRSFGIGTLLIDQRPQDVSKRVVTQCDTLICHQLTHKTDRDALRDWVRGYDTDGRGETFLASLASLEPGEAWAWSPGWLKIFERVRIDRRKTFDSGAAPDGSAAARTVQRAEVDLDSLRGQLAEIVDRAKADDPKELRRLIADLQRQVKEAEKQIAARPAAEPKVVEVPVLGDEKIARLQEVVNALEKCLGSLRSEYDEFRSAFSKVVHAPSAAPKRPAITTAARATAVHKNPGSVNQTARKPTETRAAVNNPGLGKAERAILAALYWLRSEQVTPAKVGFYSDYAAGSGSFNNALGRLRSAGLLQGWSITADGEATAEAIGVGPKPSGTDLREWLRQKLGRAENAILDALIAEHPTRLSAAQIGELSGYAPGSGSFNNALGRLRSIEAAEGYERDGGTKAADVFFE